MVASWRERMERAASSPRAQWTLAVVSAAESVFFPIPPDPMLFAMGLACPARVFGYAAITLLASVFGGVVGYGIGAFFMDSVGWPLIGALGIARHYDTVRAWYAAYDAWAVVVAGLTPVPYKLCTLTAGAFGIRFWVFVVASVIGRGLRFLTVAALVYWWGERARQLVERRLNWIVSAGVLVVIVAAVAFGVLR